MFTDVETDNEYGRTDIGSDSSEDDYEELEIEINPLKIPSLPSLIFTPEKPSDSTMVTRTVQKLQDGTVTEDEHHEDPSVNPEDRKQAGINPEEEKEKSEEPAEFGAAAFANKEEVPKIVPKPSKKSSEPLFGKKIADKVNLPPIEVNNSSKPKKTEESKEKSSFEPEDIPSGPSSSQSASRDRVQDESDCNYDSDASLYDPMAMFMKRDKINPPSDGNKTSIGKKEDSSKYRSEENRRDRLRNDRHYDEKYDHDYRDRRRPTRSAGRQRSEYDDRREEYDRRREEYDYRRDDRDRKREDRYQDDDRTRSTRRSDSRDRSPEKLGRSRDRSPVRTRSKPVRDRTRSPDRKSKKIVEKESRSRKRSHSSDEDVDRKSKKSKKKDRSPKSRKTSTDDILNEILVVDKKPDDLKARMMARMAKQKSREQTPTQNEDVHAHTKEPTPIRTIKSPDPLADSEVFVKTKEKKKSKESKKSSSSTSEPTFFVKLDKKIDLKMNENNSNSNSREERRESKRLKSKKESKSSRKRRSRSPSGHEEPEEKTQKEKEMAERMKKRAARFKQPPPAVTLVTPKVDENRTLERIIGDDAPDDVIIDDVTNNDSIENFKMSKNFENIKNRLLDRAPKSSMLPKSSTNYEDDDDDDVISIADSEVSLATTVLLNSKDVQDKRNGFEYA